jgi:hypothetical protein
VPVQKRVEGGLRRLIPPLGELLEQVPVAQTGGAAGAEKPAELPPHVPRRCSRHAPPSTRLNRASSSFLFPTAGRRNALFWRSSSIFRPYLRYC